MSGTVPVMGVKGGPCFQSSCSPQTRTLAICHLPKVNRVQAMLVPPSGREAPTFRQVLRGWAGTSPSSLAHGSCSPRSQGETELGFLQFLTSASDLSLLVCSTHFCGLPHHKSQDAKLVHLCFHSWHFVSTLREEYTAERSPEVEREQKREREGIWAI